MRLVDEREETSDDEELVDVGERRIESEEEEGVEPVIEEEMVEQDPYHLWFNKRSFTEEDKKKADTLLYMCISMSTLDPHSEWNQFRLMITFKASTLPTAKIQSRYLLPHSLRFASVYNPRRNRISLPFPRNPVNLPCIRPFRTTATCCMRRMRRSLPQTHTTSSSSLLCVSTFSTT